MSQLHEDARTPEGRHRLLTVLESYNAALGRAGALLEELRETLAASNALRRFEDAAAVDQAMDTLTASQDEIVATIATIEATLRDTAGDMH